jgi:hypothetical protein
MNSLGKCMSIAVIAVGIGLASIPQVSACPAHVMRQSAVLDRFDHPVLDRVLDNRILDRTIVQPSVLDSCGINTCGTTVMSQPAVIDTTPILDTCNTCGGGYRPILDRPGRLFDYDVY